MRTPARNGTATPTTATHGSQTILQTNTGEEPPSATLRLRAEPVQDQSSQSSSEDGRRIRWSDDVIDNEGMGKKSSKVCCIYHAPREPGDTDSDSSSSEDDSDSEPDLSRAQPAGGRKGRRSGNGGSKGKGKGKEHERRPSPNAYERQPRHKHKQTG